MERVKDRMLSRTVWLGGEIKPNLYKSGSGEPPPTETLCQKTVNLDKYPQAIYIPRRLFYDQE